MPSEAFNKLPPSLTPERSKIGEVTVRIGAKTIIRQENDSSVWQDGRFLRRGRYLPVVDKFKLQGDAVLDFPSGYPKDQNGHYTSMTFYCLQDGKVFIDVDRETYTDFGEDWGRDYFIETTRFEFSNGRVQLEPNQINGKQYITFTTEFGKGEKPRAYELGRTQIPDNVY